MRAAPRTDGEAGPGAPPPDDGETVADPWKGIEMAVTLRIEIFSDDLDSLVDFYTRVLRFRLDRDERAGSPGYVALSRGTVRIGAAERRQVEHLDGRRPPAGTEIVLEVDDVRAELAAVQAAGWPLEEGLQDRHWGLADFRLLDPAGYYLRITHR